MLALLLVAMAPAAVVNTSHYSVSSSPKLVATQVCACATQASGSSSTLPELRGHGPPNQVNYDEQLGITFTQSFTSLEYNVTAVVQTDPLLDTGPAYLLNGLSDTGFWYQVGVSWNWGPGQTPGTGFDMIYEVFNPSGNSIYPINGGGLSAFSGTVNPGDMIVLNLYFNSGQVVMLSEDLNTGAYAQQTFSAESGTFFTGLNNVANSNGFFTGLMTEWYHGAPYYANLQGTLYSTNVTISSGWMWMDEFNANNDQLVFAGNSTSPSSFTADPTQLQEFAYNGTTEYASGLEFVTGAAGGTTTTTSASTTNSSSAVTSTQTFTVNVPTTITQTTTATATATTTATVIQPVTTTVTSTQSTTITDTTTSTAPPSTTTATQTTTQTTTASSIGALPLWSYLLMLALLFAGIGAGYLFRGQGPKSAQSSTV